MLIRGGAMGRGPAVEVRAPRRVEEALDYLYRDPFPNASLIASIERKATGDVQVYVATENSIRGVLVIGLGSEGVRLAGLDADEVDVAESLFRTVRMRERLQFGLHRPGNITALHRVCQATPMGIMLAFRHDGPCLAPRDLGEARELGRADERVVRGARDEPFLHSYRQAIGAQASREAAEVRTFGVIEGSRLLARCLTTWASRGIERQVGTVWSVYTDPSARGRGLGRAVVAAASTAILNAGRIARYFAFSDNIPSLRICRSLGYREDHAVRYFLAQRRR